MSKRDFYIIETELDREDRERATCIANQLGGFVFERSSWNDSLQVFGVYVVRVAITVTEFEVEQIMERMLTLRGGFGSVIAQYDNSLSTRQKEVLHSNPPYSRRSIKSWMLDSIAGRRQHHCVSGPAIQAFDKFSNKRSVVEWYLYGKKLPSFLSVLRGQRLAPYMRDNGLEPINTLYQAGAITLPALLAENIEAMNTL